MSFVFKHTTVFWLIMMGLVPPTQAQVDEAKLTGKWTNEDRTRVLEFVKTGDTYEAIIRQAPDKEMIGKKQITGLVYKGGTFKGTLHLPKKNKVLPCTLVINSDGLLELSAKSGFIGQKQTWSKLD